jgi:hypothetical protein
MNYLGEQVRCQVGNRKARQDGKGRQPGRSLIYRTHLWKRQQAAGFIPAATLGTVEMLGTAGETPPLSWSIKT